MQRTFFLLLFISSSFLAWATHIRSGYITYRNVGYLSYEATVITFTKASSTQADRDTIQLSWGDGTFEPLLRINGPIDSSGLHTGEVLDNDLKLNIYQSSVHIYPDICEYTISASDANRISNIINIGSGASVNVQFYIEAHIHTLSGSCGNSGISSLSYPILFANVGDTLFYNPTAIDIDGDSLSFELIAPLADKDWAVPNYQYPDEVSPGINNVFSINPISGMVSWFTPQREGIYNIAIQVNKYKNGFSYGHIIFDTQILVTTSAVSPPTFNTNWTTDVNGNYSFFVNPGDTIQLDFTASADTLKAIGEVFGLPASSFLQTGSGSALNGSFQWTPDSAHSRLQPYITTFRGVRHYNGIDYENDLTALVYVTGGTRNTCPSPSPCTLSVAENSSANNNVIITPNPFSSVCEIQVNGFFKQEKSLTLHLYDLTGKCMGILNSTEGKFILHRENLSEGLYLFEIHNKQHLVNVGKVMVN